MDRDTKYTAMLANLIAEHGLTDRYALLESALELADALEPLANIDIEHLEERPDDWPLWGVNDSRLSVGDVRRAREALRLAGRG